MADTTQTTIAPPQELPVKTLEAKHEEYQAYQPIWENITLLNVGGDMLKVQASRFLRPRPKEPIDVYQERIRRFTYQPLLPTMVGWYSGKLYQRNPQINLEGGQQSFWDAFLANCDRAETSFIDISRKWFEDAVNFGRSWVLVDKPRPDGDNPPETKADVLEQGLNEPYLVNYDPQQVINWAKDEDGKLEWVIVRTEDVEQESPFKKPVKKCYWYIFDRKNYYVYSCDSEKVKESQAAADGDGAMAELDGTGAHALAELNIVPLRCIEVPFMLWLANRAYLHLIDYLDTENTYSWKLFLCNTPWLVITGSDDISTIDRSETSYLKLSADSKVAYLEPNPATFKESRERLVQLREEIYRSFYLQAQGRSSSATASEQSGYSKEMDMAPANDVLNRFGDMMIAAMQRTLGDVAAARGETVTVDVRGFRFESKPVLAEVEVAQAVIDLGTNSPTLERVAMQRVGEGVADDSDEETKQKIKDEIESNPTPGEQAAIDREQQRQAFQQSLERASNKEVLAREQSSVQ